MRRILMSLALLIGGLMTMGPVSPAAQAREPEVSTLKPSFFGGTWDAALNGFDTVAYHTEGRPVRGTEDFETQYLGVTWRFASQENLDLFLAEPDKYRPAYGGYCAWATAEGYLAAGDPEVWKIVDGRLYLNYNRKVSDTWSADIPGFVAKADANWPTILDEK